jgi:hypothetical protein
MPIFEGALVAPEAGAGGGEEGDIAGAADPHGLALLVPDLAIPDEALNDPGHDGGFVFAHKIAIEFALVVFVAIIDRDFETGDGRAVGGSRAGCRQGRETGLSGRL